MKKLLLIFLFVSAFVFGQEKALFKVVSYDNLIEFYNQELGLKDEDLSGNIERCKYIVADAKSKDDHQTEFAFLLFLRGLTEASATDDKALPFLSIYKDPTSYNFYDSQNKFVGRVYKEKLDEQIYINGDNTETYISNYFYLMQE